MDLMRLQGEIIWFLFTENEEPTETGLLPSVLFFFKRETQNLDGQMFKHGQDTPSTKCLWTKTTRHRANPSLRLPIGSPWCTHCRKTDSEAVDLG